MMADSINTVLCKICSIAVPPRRLYQPTSCEACQKFFRRNCSRRGELICTNASGSNCVVDHRKGGRICKKCRLDKCLASGMWSKYLCNNPLERASDRPEVKLENLQLSSDDASSSQTSDEAQTTSSEPETKVVEWATVSLVNDPVLVDGTNFEQLMRNTVQAYTRLHGLEFLPMKNAETAICDPREIARQGMQQARHTLNISASYARHFAELYRDEIAETELQTQIAHSLAHFNAIFQNLPSNRGVSFFGFHESFLPVVFTRHPEYRLAFNDCNALACVLEEWNPSLPEVSLLLSILFFCDYGNNNPRVANFQRHLMLTLQLYCSTLNQYDPAHRTRTLGYFKKCFRYALSASKNLFSSFASLAFRSPSAATLSRMVHCEPLTNSICFEASQIAGGDNGNNGNILEKFPSNLQQICGNIDR